MKLINFDFWLFLYYFRDRNKADNPLRYFDVESEDDYCVINYSDERLAMLQVEWTQ